MKIAVLGGGNGSFAAAGDFALSGHQVRLWRRDADQVAAHRAAGSRILVKDHNGSHDVKLALVTASIAEAVNGAELILCPAPAFAQPDIARLLAPHLRDGQVVFLPPATFGSMIFAQAARDTGNHAKALQPWDRVATARGIQAGPDPAASREVFESIVARWGSRKRLLRWD